MMQPHILLGFNNLACTATSVSCLQNNHSVQSTVKASASRSFTPSASNSTPSPPLPPPNSPTTPPPDSSTGCNALWDWITKSQMQLVVLSEAVVSAAHWHAPLCPCALVAGKLEFHQIFCAKDVYKKPKFAPDRSLCFAAKQEESRGFLTGDSVVSLFSLRIK